MEIAMRVRNRHRTSLPTTDAPFISTSTPIVKHRNIVCSGIGSYHTGKPVRERYVVMVMVCCQIVLRNEAHSGQTFLTDVIEMFT